MFIPLPNSVLVMVLQATKNQGEDHCIEVLYNGMRVELPGCHYTQGLCSLESFLVSGLLFSPFPQFFLHVKLLAIL